MKLPELPACGHVAAFLRRRNPMRLPIDRRDRTDALQMNGKILATLSVCRRRGAELFGGSRKALHRTGRQSRAWILSAYVLESSNPMNRRPSFLATISVVRLPPNGSSTVPRIRAGIDDPPEQRLGHLAAMETRPAP